MYLIKTCPTCKTKIRFPLDKGIIRVTCACGYSFIANPDNTDIYRDASFDLRNAKYGSDMMDSLKKAFTGITVVSMKAAIINSFLNAKYKIQNFRLLPDSERKKVILTLLFICAGVIVLIVAIYFATHISVAGSKIIV